MPQLALETFFSQYFWLVVIFFTLYFIMINKLIPSISEALKIRNTKLEVKGKVTSHIVKDSSLIKDIATFKLNSNFNTTSYSPDFNNNFLSWSSKGF